MKKNKFDINICLAILSTDIPKNKKYILSTNKDQLEIPQLSLTYDYYNNIDNAILDFLKDKIVVNPLELRPALLSINSKNLPKIFDNTQTLNLLYGSVIPLNSNINNVYWLEFDFLLPHEYSNLLFEVIHTLS